MAVNKNVREKLSIYRFVFEIQRWAVKGIQMFMVSINSKHFSVRAFFLSFSTHTCKNIFLSRSIRVAWHEHSSRIVWSTLYACPHTAFLYRRYKWMNQSINIAVTNTARVPIGMKFKVRRKVIALQPFWLLLLTSLLSTKGRRWLKAIFVVWVGFLSCSSKNWYQLWNPVKVLALAFKSPVKQKREHRIWYGWLQKYFFAFIEECWVA